MTAPDTHGAPRPLSGRSCRSRRRRTPDLAPAARPPGADAARERLLDVAYRTVDSPVGPLLLAATERGLLRVAFEREGHELVLDRIARQVSPRILRDGLRLDVAARELDEYFAGRRRAFDLPLDLQLAHGFRRVVLDHLERDRVRPHGQLRRRGRRGRQPARRPGGGLGLRAQPAAARRPVPPGGQERRLARAVRRRRRRQEPAARLESPPPADPRLALPCTSGAKCTRRWGFGVHFGSRVHAEVGVQGVGGGAQRLVEVGDEVGGVLEPARQPQQRTHRLGATPPPDGA